MLRDLCERCYGWWGDTIAAVYRLTEPAPLWVCPTAVGRWPENGISELP
jgi:hypothetical protein